MTLKVTGSNSADQLKQMSLQKPWLLFLPIFYPRIAADEQCTPAWHGCLSRCHACFSTGKTTSYVILILPKIHTTDEPSKYKLNLLRGQRSSQKTNTYLKLKKRRNKSQSSWRVVAAKLCSILSKLCFLNTDLVTRSIWKYLLIFGTINSGGGYTSNERKQYGM